MSFKKHGVGEIIETETEQGDALSKQASTSWNEQDEQALSDEE